MLESMRSKCPLMEETYQNICQHVCVRISIFPIITLCTIAIVYTLVLDELAGSRRTHIRRYRRRFSATSPPGLPRTSVGVLRVAGAIPPIRIVVVPVYVAVVVSEVQQHTQTAPVLSRVRTRRQFHGSFPPEVLVVERVVRIELAEVFGERLRTLEVVDVDERVWRSDCFVVFSTRAHHHRNDVVPEVIQKRK